MNKKILVSLITLIVMFTACSNRNNKISQQEVEKSQTQETEATEKLETEENSQEEDFSEYQEYVDEVYVVNLLNKEFSKGNYPVRNTEDTEYTQDISCLYNLGFLYLVDNEKLDEFEGTFNDRDWMLHKAEDVEENLKEKFDITTEELRSRLPYIEDKNAYPVFPKTDYCFVGGGPVIKDVIQEENTFKIHYEYWFRDYNSDLKKGYDGILTVSKEGKIISNSDIKQYNPTM